MQVLVAAPILDATLALSKAMFAVRIAPGNGKAKGSQMRDCLRDRDADATRPGVVEESGESNRAGADDASVGAVEPFYQLMLMVGEARCRS